MKRIVLYLLFFATPALADEPDKLTRLRANFDSAVQRATVPLKKTYMQELEKLKIEYTRAAKLEEAMAVAEELKKLQSVATDVSTESNPEKPKLTKRQQEEMIVTYLTELSWKYPGGHTVTFYENGKVTMSDGSADWSFTVKDENTIIMKGKEIKVDSSKDKLILPSWSATGEDRWLERNPPK